ncbi:MAG TPA: hypothetical protein VFZ59_18980 [Verrucomicrobiae bacterium]|nr:hypothetical protein [Verrucomicrobiae bacterium]
MKKAKLVELVPVLAILLFCAMGHAAETNGIPSELTNAGIEWGSETNGIRAGLVAFQVNNKRLIKIMVLSSKTNSALGYVSPPDLRFAKLELRNEEGKLVAQTQEGKKVNRELPKEILASDLPVMKQERMGRGRELYAGLVMTSPGSPVSMGSFNLEDLFQTDPQTRYSLAVCPVIYKFTHDRRRVLRVDMPCVAIEVGPAKR